MADSFVPEAQRLGLDVAGVEAVEPNQASFTAQLLRLQQAGVEILVVSATAEAIGIIRDAKSHGLPRRRSPAGGSRSTSSPPAGRSLFDGVAGFRAVRHGRQRRLRGLRRPHGRPGPGPRPHRSTLEGVHRLRPRRCSSGRCSSGPGPSPTAAIVRGRRRDDPGLRQRHPAARSRGARATTSASTPPSRPCAATTTTRGRAPGPPAGGVLNDAPSSSTASSSASSTACSPSASSSCTAARGSSTSPTARPA